MNRIPFVDWLRVIACFMVMLVHSIEPFYLGGEGTQILNEVDALWSTLLDSALRAAVPLFVIASSYLLFPLQTSSEQFFKRRFVRVLVPFVVWTLIYAVVTGIMNGEMTGGFKQIIFNFIGAWGHLWFVYMLIGVYLIMPIISPWAEKVSKKGEMWLLIVWLFTTTIPFIREAAQAIVGSPNLWGVASWNEFGTFYYVSGFIGYLVLGHYFKKWVPELSWKKTLLIAIPTWVVGYGITALWFWLKMPHNYPVSAPIDLAVEMEIGWVFSAFGVALTVIAYFLVLRKINFSGAFYRHIVVPLSKASYGTYLIHLLFLIEFCKVFRPIMSTGLCIICTALSTFIAASLVSYILGKIPKVGKYLVG